MFEQSRTADGITDEEWKIIEERAARRDLRATKKSKQCLAATAKHEASV